MIKIILFIFALILPVIAISDIYKWTDSDGRAYYTDAMPKSRYKRVIKSRTFQYLNSNKYLNESPLSKNQKNAIEKYIKNRLSDPYTAHFKWPKNTEVYEGNMVYYCAFVNSKNKFGGYVGYTPFKVTLIESKKGWQVEEAEYGGGVYCSPVDD